LLYEAGASFTMRELRLRKAAALLAHVGEQRISDVAFECGFNDLSYFQPLLPSPLRPDADGGAGEVTSKAII
jgi:AraC-like DNA-binding protein